MNVFITGVRGFVGREIATRALATGHSVAGSSRGPDEARPALRIVGNLPLSPETQWGRALEGHDVIVHAAAHVHVADSQARQDIAEFRRINVDGTLSLARQAKAAGVRRFIFISSIAVNGLDTFGKAFRADDEPSPKSPYGLSKLEAERALRSLDSPDFGVVIIRPPLVYGPDAPGNFRRMLRILSTGVPLPFGAIRNARSLVAVENLADLALTCGAHPQASGRTFLVSDGEDLSTTDLLRRVARALRKPARLLPIPEAVVRAALVAIGRGELARQLLHSLQVDIGPTRETLGWNPPVTVDDALARAVAKRHS